MSEELDPKIKEQIDKLSDVEKAELMTRADYIQLAALVNKEMKGMSAKGVTRSVFAGLDHEITDSRVKFANEKEARVAGLFKKLLDLRTVIQAINVQKKENNENE